VTAVIVEDGVTSIEKNTFQYCLLLRRIKLPENLLRIGTGAFKLCKSLITITLPKSLIKIGKSAFFGCSSLKFVKIPESITELPFETFSECASLTSVILPPALTMIGSMAFYACEALVSIHFPPSLMKVGYDAFAYCKKVSIVEVSSNAVGELSFSNCHSLFDSIIHNPFATNEMLKNLFIAIPSAACLQDVHGRTSLDILLSSKRMWEDSPLVRDEKNGYELLFGRPLLFYVAASKVKWSYQIESIYKRNLSAVKEIDPLTGLAPFMVASVGPSSDLETVYRLLIAYPTAIHHCT